MSNSTVVLRLRARMGSFLERLSAPEPRTSVIARLSAVGLHITENEKMDRSTKVLANRFDSTRNTYASACGIIYRRLERGEL